MAWPRPVTSSPTPNGAWPTECPGWDVKDQLSHLIGIERALMGEAAPAWDGPYGDHVQNDFARSNEPWIAVRRPFPGDAVRAEFVEVTGTRLGQLDQLTEDEWATVGFTPVGSAPTRSSWRSGSSTAGCTSRTCGSPWTARAGAATWRRPSRIDRVQGAMGYVVGKRAGCPEGSAVRFAVAGPERDARDFTVAVRGRAGPARSVTTSRRPSPCRSRASTSSGSAVAGSAPPAGGRRVDRHRGGRGGRPRRARRHELHGLSPSTCAHLGVWGGSSPSGHPNFTFWLPCPE